MVSLDAADEATERLAGAGLKAAVRATGVRLSCRLYNDEEDVDRTLEVLTDFIHGSGGVILGTLGESSRVVAHEPEKITETSIGRRAISTGEIEKPRPAKPEAELLSQRQLAQALGRSTYWVDARVRDGMPFEPPAEGVRHPRLPACRCGGMARAPGRSRPA